MFKNIQNFFDFNRAERNSVVILCVLLFAAFLLPSILRHNRKIVVQDNSVFKMEVEALKKALASQSDSATKRFSQNIDFEHVDRSIVEQELTPFSFNPNEMTPERWKQLGLKDWQIRILNNYTTKGGRFFKKEDFQKIYGISSAQYDVLAPYIIIPAAQSVAQKSNDRPEYIAKPKPVVIDLNNADSATLVTLNGIGPSFARRIIKFRNLLGGFYSTAQLLEVYGFDSVRYEKIARFCSVNPDNVKKLNINTATTDELRKHPYFDYYLAKAIVDRRIIQGKYTSVSQVSQLPLAHEDLYNKIRNYLTIDENYAGK
ncbi:MAG TPA: helix-hairpin-helix domain-containing protein [Bacteroidales bacterium]|nr:helix-hairpin-helix domain-containing protein [Bacteroidales bacterium]